MAWRPSEYLIDGELDNTTPGRVTGWLQFAGMAERVTLDLEGDFHRDIRGAKVHLQGNGRTDDPHAAEYMQDFDLQQTGKVGDTTAGRPPADYVKYPYFEWYSDGNGRIVIELAPDQVQLLSQPIPASESDPISRGEQKRNMANFLASLSEATGVPAISIGTSAS